MEATTVLEDFSASTTEPATKESVKTTIQVLGYLITIFGILGNSLSLFYFISKSSTNSRSGESDTSTTHLFVSLNIFDIIVCVASFIILTIDYNIDPESEIYLSVGDAVFFLAQEMTYFVTCLLSFRRVLNLLLPLYLVKRKTLNIAMVIFLLLMTTIEICFWALQQKFDEDDNPMEKSRSLIRIALILVIILSNILSFMKLRQSFALDNHKRTRYATVTVAILSGIFCACNIGPMIGSGIFAFDAELYSSIDDSISLHDIFYSVLIPLNSACNPVVYITRRSDMRNFFTAKWRRVKEKCGCGTVRDIKSDVTSRSADCTYRNSCRAVM